MKKIIALILTVIMMFSMTSVSYATDTATGAETSVNTIDNYMDYLEEKLEGENFFVKLIARLVIIGVMLGFIKIEDFEAWFDNTAPDTDTDTDTDIDIDKPTVDDSNTNTDWEDGTELTLHHAQSLPYTQAGVTINSIKITKEHCDELNSDNVICKYKYNITIEGNAPNYNDTTIMAIYICFENQHGFVPGFYSSGSHLTGDFSIDENKNFTMTTTKLLETDSERFSIYSIESWDSEY